MVKEFMEAAHKQGMSLVCIVLLWDRNDGTYGTPLYVQHYREELTELYSNWDHFLSAGTMVQMVVMGIMAGKRKKDY